MNDAKIETPAEVIANSPFDEAAARSLGFSDEECRLVREHRERQAEERRRAEIWIAALKELFDPEEGNDSKAWEEAAALFVRRSGGAGWTEDDTLEFTVALMRAVGFRAKNISRHGEMWELTAPD
jgi:hypothetical protein